MGYRLHVAKKFVVEYANIEGFNYCEEEFFNLLDIFGIKYPSDGYIEIYKEEFKEMIDVLKNYDKKLPLNNPVTGENFEAGDFDRIVEIAKEMGCSNPVELGNELEKFLNAADPESDYVVFFWS